MSRTACLLVLPAQLLLATVLLAQGTTSQATATCNFDANNQVVVEYQRFSVIPTSRCWATKSRTAGCGLPAANR